MNTITKLIVTVQVATGQILEATRHRRRQLADERGSLTLEQIIITVALAVVAIAAVAIIVAAINSKAAELPL
jgi:hypothetical protein